MCSYIAVYLVIYILYMVVQILVNELSSLLHHRYCSLIVCVYTVYTMSTWCLFSVYIYIYIYIYIYTYIIYDNQPKYA